ncbi:MAG: phosphate acyltransferase PlsX [Bacteroidota bacterium]
MIIAIDAMGGDFAPKSVVEGSIEALAVLPNTDYLVLIGQQDKLKELFGDQYNHPQLKIIDAHEVIEMGEHPTKALSQKPNSSISLGFKMLKNHEIDVFCSAGNTGAMMVGSMFSVKVIEGIQRPAIVGFAPKVNGGKVVILDIGANADCKPEMLEQFAELGSIYATATLNIEKPRVALMNIGEEEQKGTLVAQAAYQLMKDNKSVNFVGNVEGKDLFLNKADVIVCDGFTGNVILKLGESMYEILASQGITNDFLAQANYEETGGSPIIGINENVIIGHGASTPKAIKNMILLAQNQVKSNVTQKMKEAFA